MKVYLLELYLDEWFIYGTYTTKELATKYAGLAMADNEAITNYSVREMEVTSE